MNEIWLLRHGETTANAEGVWQGQGPAGLSERGLRQAAAVGERLAGLPFDLVVSSDLRRTMATAAVAGLAAEVDPGFREMDVGGWEGLTQQEVRERFPDQLRALASGVDVALGGGETWAAFCSRVDAAINGLLTRLEDKGRVLVVTHGGVVHAVVAGLLRFRTRGLPWPVEHVRNTALTVITGSPAGRRLRTYNDATHLEAAPPSRPGSTVVGLARHGESLANVAEVWHGVTDGPLSPRGAQQGAELAARYEAVEHVYTSHLQRARLTAESFSPGRPPQVRHDLHEIDFGTWEGLTAEEISSRFPAYWSAINDDRRDLPRGGTGETMGGAAARLGRALSQIAAAHPGGRVLVFTHGGAIRAFVGSVVGLGLDAREILEGPANISVTHLRVRPEGALLVDYNLGVV
jgi:broad specificity phosphatase PhoE